MKASIKKISLTASLVILLMSSILSSGLVLAADKDQNIMKMAEIMQRLKHFPSPAGKQTLQQIISSSATSKNQRILATAMLNLNHKAIDSDKPKLKSIIDGSASANEKQLATIILNLDHRPSKADKQALSSMMN